MGSWRRKWKSSSLPRRPHQRSSTAGVGSRRMARAKPRSRRSRRRMGGRYHRGVTRGISPPGAPKTWRRKHSPPRGGGRGGGGGGGGGSHAFPRRLGRGNPPDQRGKSRVSHPARGDMGPSPL